MGNLQDCRIRFLGITGEVNGPAPLPHFAVQQVQVVVQIVQRVGLDRPALLPELLPDRLGHLLDRLGPGIVEMVHHPVQHALESVVGQGP